MTPTLLPFDKLRKTPPDLWERGVRFSEGQLERIGEFFWAVAGWCPPAPQMPCGNLGGVEEVEVEEACFIGESVQAEFESV